jgi:hypothetical protein
VKGRTDRSLPRQRRLYGAIRTVLISYGIAAYTLVLPSFGLGDGARAVAGIASPQTLMLIGLGMQIILLAARWLIKRHVADSAAALQAFDVLNVIGDGVTVLLFALGTFGAIMPAMEDI